MKNIRMIVSSGPLKTIARQKLKGHWFEAAAIFLIVELFGNAGQRLFTDNMDLGTTSGADLKSVFNLHSNIILFGGGMGILSFFIGGAIAVGGIHYVLNLLRDNDPKFSDILYGFKYYWRSFKQAFLFNLILVLPILVIVVVAILISVGLSQRVDTILLASIILFTIFILAWLVYSIVISYALSFRYFQVADEHYEYMGAFDSFRVCARAMKGNKAHLFGVELSFIGWYLLAAIPGAIVQVAAPNSTTAFVIQLLLMIPFAFIAAYLYTTEGVYYRILTGELKIDVVDDSPIEQITAKLDTSEEATTETVDSESDITMEDPKFPPNVDHNTTNDVRVDSPAESGRDDKVLEDPQDSDRNNRFEDK